MWFVDFLFLQLLSWIVIPVRSILWEWKLIVVYAHGTSIHSFIMWFWTWCYSDNLMTPNIFFVNTYVLFSYFRSNLNYLEVGGNSLHWFREKEMFFSKLWHNWCGLWFDYLLCFFYLSGSTYSAWSVIFVLSLRHPQTGNTAEMDLGLIAASSPESRHSWKVPH